MWGETLRIAIELGSAATSQGACTRGEMLELDEKPSIISSQRICIQHRSANGDAFCVRMVIFPYLPLTASRLAPGEYIRCDLRFDAFTEQATTSFFGSGTERPYPPHFQSEFRVHRFGRSPPHEPLSPGRPHRAMERWGEGGVGNSGEVTASSTRGSQNFRGQSSVRK